MPPSAERQLRAMYAAFNARDLDAVLAAMSADVDWPNAWEGGRLHGREAVRDYWTRQWAAIDPRVEPVSITAGAGGEVTVGVRQVVRSLDGDLLSESDVRHVYRLRDGLITRMDVVD
jgi:ketosteroid isomerase-like protein